MFNRKKNHAIDTLIDETMNIRGSMNFSGGIRLDGRLQGNLTLTDGTYGSLIMGPKSKISGDITYGDIEIHAGATVNGNITRNKQEKVIKKDKQAKEKNNDK